MDDRGRGPTGAAMRRALRLVVRRGLRGVWLRGRLPPGPFVWAANHHSWWDPFVAMVLLHRSHRCPCVLMLQRQLDRYPFARPLGVFGTAEPRRGLACLGEGRVLVIYPEGGLRPAGPPGELAGGAAWYATRAGVPLCAGAARVLMRGQQTPEAYVWVAVVPDGGGEGTAALTARLARQLADQLDELERLNATADPRTALPGFALVVAGRRSWDERVDRAARWLPWPR
jgi:1-acyl-sn-glycerol-3-phosphate acyltransferase